MSSFLAINAPRSTWHFFTVGEYTKCVIYQDSDGWMGGKKNTASGSIVNVDVSVKTNTISGVEQHLQRTRDTHQTLNEHVVWATYSSHDNDLIFPKRFAMLCRFLVRLPYLNSVLPQANSGAYICSNGPQKHLGFIVPSSWEHTSDMIACTSPCNVAPKAQQTHTHTHTEHQVSKSASSIGDAPSCWLHHWCSEAVLSVWPPHQPRGPRCCRWQRIRQPQAPRYRRSHRIAKCHPPNWRKTRPTRYCRTLACTLNFIWHCEVVSPKWKKTWPLLSWSVTHKFSGEKVSGCMFNLARMDSEAQTGTRDRLCQLVHIN